MCMPRGICCSNRVNGLCARKGIYATYAYIMYVVQCALREVLTPKHAKKKKKLLQ